ncbi:uncharacterized protein G2W53_000419 [Senna tora]|uniref:Uncharacterized protein n=1 Tax=Senna tora TaxID=362788 RepID=A0A834XFN9_9FABA|nr:uncharacterized protein G2W53_000419 [Senna tora]
MDGHGRGVIIPNTPELRVQT